MSKIDYYSKYLKYKAKYVDLKDKIGGDLQNFNKELFEGENTIKNEFNSIFKTKSESFSKIIETFETLKKNGSNDETIRNAFDQILKDIFGQFLYDEFLKTLTPEIINEKIKLPVSTKSKLEMIFQIYKIIKNANDKIIQLEKSIKENEEDIAKNQSHEGSDLHINNLEKQIENYENEIEKIKNKKNIDLKHVGSYIIKVGKI